ncbi:MAG: hypothetical protein Q8K35_07305 [Thiobacillus sp.]|nr:hypothetical protein [Thiobacillus sp.]MDP2057551.1 hypothetical protein [Thiobacillus sp.]
MAQQDHGHQGGGEMGGMGGMPCCKGKQGGGGGDTAALERRISELEKCLDLMQLMLQRKQS